MQFKFQPRKNERRWVMYVHLPYGAWRLLSFVGDTTDLITMIYYAERKWRKV